jgi:hypothetical protein
MGSLKKMLYSLACLAPGTGGPIPALIDRFSIRAARLLGMNPTTLNSKIKTYNINLRS